MVRATIRRRGMDRGVDKGLLATFAAAVLAALGYVGKQLADLIIAQVGALRMRRARLNRRIKRFEPR